MLTVAATVLGAGRAAAQPASDAPRIAASAEVSILGIDVVVADKNGKPIHGLTAADFELHHGGKPVVITNFHEERREGTGALPGAPAGRDPSGAVPGGAEMAVSRQPRKVVVFVDRLYLPEPSRRRELFDGVKEFLARTLTGPGDEAMVVSWGDSVRVVRSFTDDLAALDETLDVVARRVARLDSQANEVAELAARDHWFGSLATDPRVGGTVGSTEISREIGALQAYGTMKAKVTALRGLVALMAGMEGRKSLVLLAHHFGRYPGREFHVGPRSAPVGASNLRDGQPLLEELAAAANASGVTLYGIYPYERVAFASAADSAALNPTTSSAAYGSGFDAIWTNEMAGLDFVTKRTGGSTAGHPGELPRFLDQVASDLGSYYSLGFPASGAARPEAVKVRVKREGLTVRTRTTVAERTAEERLTDRALANLFAPDANSRIGISVVAGEAMPAGKKFRIPLEVRIPLGALVRLPGPAAAKGKFSVFVVAATPKGDFSEVARRRQEFEVKRGEEAKADASHLTYTLEVESEAPAPRISLAVWDEIGGEAGFALVGKRKG
ncbi:MAG: VWA domain-containing protein [Thermoanaerobaculia bacterium]